MSPIARTAWLASVAVFAVCVIACGFGKKGDTSSDARAVAIGEDVDCGDLHVSVSSVLVQPFISDAPGGPIEHRPALVVRLKITNANPNKKLWAKSQINRAQLVDDVGNEYKPLETKDEAGNLSIVRGQITPDKERAVRSEEPQTDVLVYEKPVAGASRITVTLDTSPYGKPGGVRVTVPREVFSPAAKK